MLVPCLYSGMPALYVAAALNGLSFAFFNVATQSLVGVLSAPGERAKNYSNFGLMTSVGNLAGPMCAGLIVDHGGYTLAISGFGKVDPTPGMLHGARHFVPMFAKRWRMLSPGGLQAWQAGFETRRRWARCRPASTAKTRPTAM